MKKVSAVVLCMFMLAFPFASTAFAEMQFSLSNHIPGHYVLLSFTGAAPDKKLDKKRIIAIVEEQFKKANVEQLQFAVYDEGKKNGDGIRVFGAIQKDTQGNDVLYEEISGEMRENKGKVKEEILGYYLAPEHLYRIYTDNEVVADEDFTGKTLFMPVTVPKVSKGAKGKVYIKVPVDAASKAGVQIYLDTNDPLLPYITKGSQIHLRVYPQKFASGNVIANGTIIFDGKGLLLDGKRVAPGK